MRNFTTWMLIAACSTFLSGQAAAHSFNVALLIPMSGPNKADGKAFRDGFRLATKERDAHAGETSDGHLGGLDVHLSTADAHEAELAGLKSLLDKKKMDLIVSTGPNQSVDTTLVSLAGDKSVVLTPGRLPFPNFAQGGLPDESSTAAAFVTAFEKEFGYQPPPVAARGYHAARRIDAAVRSLGGVDDKPHLHRMLRQSRSGFNW